MKREVVAEGPSVAEAVDAALEQLGVQQDAVEFEILEEGTGDSLLGGAPARVRVWLRAEAILPRTDEPG
ncbi:MAG: Jag N-terminal domain-containing protein, partial [Coriobacteriia bacterium]|nr:Jag N-terminal domain-containing protein [Coriobacteriia bacterium]